MLWLPGRGSQDPKEVGTADFDLLHLLNFGPLPAHYLSSSPRLAIRSYVETYLKEEILDEGLVRKLPAFFDFLRVAGIRDTEAVNLANISRECGVSSATVREHYNILVDTLMGAFLPAYTYSTRFPTVCSEAFSETSANFCLGRAIGVAARFTAEERTTAWGRLQTIGVAPAAELEAIAITGTCP